MNFRLRGRRKGLNKRKHVTRKKIYIKLRLRGRRRGRNKRKHVTKKKNCRKLCLRAVPFPVREGYSGRKSLHNDI